MFFWLGISWLIAGFVSFVFACYFFFVDDNIELSWVPLVVAFVLFIFGWISFLLYINMFVRLYIDYRKEKVIQEGEIKL